MKPFDTRGYALVQGVRIMGARLHLHWSALALAAALLALWIRQPAQALEAVGSYFGVLLLHEMGHAAMARRLGYRATDIRLAIMHRLCDYDAPDTERDDALIAWGGVLAQLALALPLIALAQVPAVAALPGAGILVGVFGYLSVLVALFNLTPAAPLDGAKAWRLVPILLGARRRRAIARKATQDLMQRLK
jgi:Zn-dependent protease